MAVSFYIRKGNFKSLLYKALIVIVLVGFLFTLANKKTDYTILLFIVYSIVEIFLNPTSIKIDSSELTIIKQILGGILKKEQYIKIDKINKVFSIGLDISNDASTDTGTGIIWWGNVDSEKPFDLYQIEFTDQKNVQRTVKINLYTNECNMLKEKMRATSNLQKLG